MKGGFFKEFRDFAMRGNVVDMAVGIIIGAAFGKIVSSLVNDIIMPPFGFVLGRANFNSLFLSLNGRQYESLEAAKAAGAATWNYGVFLTAVLDFLIVALAMFLVVRQINALRRLYGPDTPSSKDCPYCCTKISAKATRCPQCTSDLGQAVG